MGLDELAKNNPWWKGDYKIEKDPFIQQFEKLPLKWRPRLKHYVKEKLGEDVIASIRGPRQVGKTTLVKLIIKEKLEGGANPFSLCYFSCDRVSSYKRLYQLLNEYLDWAKTLTKERKTIILDEISKVKEWWKAIKSFKEENPTNLSILVTGSHSVDLRKSLDYFTGRSGEYLGLSTHKILMPMKFAEYVELRKPGIHEVIKQNHLYSNQEKAAARDKLFAGEVSPSLQALRPFLADLNGLFDEYLLTGGIMTATNSFVERETIPREVYEVYLKYLSEDTTELRRDRMITDQVLRAIIGSMGSRTNWNRLKRKTDATLQTVRDYCRLLQKMFVVDITYKMDENGLPDPLSHDKKVFIGNPFFFHAIRGNLDGVDDYFAYSVEGLTNANLKANLVEAVVGDHLARLAYSYNPSDIFEVWRHLLFYSNKHGHEVDYVVNAARRRMGFEVKYRNRIGKDDFKGLLAFRSKFKLMITKNQFGPFSETLPIMMIPAPLYLLLI